MRGIQLLPAVVLLLTSAPAWGSGGDPSWDGLLTQSAAVPDASTVRVSVGGGGFADRGVDTGGTVGSSLLWAPIARLAANVSTTWEAGTTSPAAAVRYQILTQNSLGLDGTLSVGYRAVGFESVGSEGEARLALGRTIGILGLNTNAMIGKGFGARSDVDFEAGAAIMLRIAWFLRTGVEGRYRTELVDDLHTDEDDGRSAEWTVGSVTSFRFDELRIQALGGWRAPRGLAEPGPIALASVSFDF